MEFNLVVDASQKYVVLVTNLREMTLVSLEENLEPSVGTLKNKRYAVGTLKNRDKRI